MAFVIAIVLIGSGLIIPTFIPDEFSQSVPGFEDASWIKAIISMLLIGMGIVSFIWLVIIHRFMMHKSKKDYMY
jgi:hypothetical protein